MNNGCDISLYSQFATFLPRELNGVFSLFVLYLDGLVINSGMLLFTYAAGV